MKRAPFVFVLALLAGACGDDDGTPPPGVDAGSDAATDAAVDTGGGVDAGTDSGGTDTGSGGPTDITDAIFTERSGDCADYADTYVAMVMDIQRSLGFTGSVELVAGTDACTLTSNADTDSSHTMSSGRTAKARAMPKRCR